MNIQQKIKIAITGGIGSGKSQVLQCVKNLGYPTVSCDEIYKKVILSSQYLEEVKKYFPEVIIENKIDRKKLAEIIFTDDKKREQLNSIAHPIIMKNVFAEMENSVGVLSFAEVPLLFEGKFEKEFDFVIVVQREKSRRIEDIRNRDGLSYEKIKERINSQIDYDDTRTINDFKKENYFIIDNNNSIDELKEKVFFIIHSIKTRTL